MNTKFILGAVLFFGTGANAAINNKIETNIKTKKIPIIAVVDTGADIKHEEIKKFIWVNPGEVGTDVFGHDKGTNNIDDDGNGFVDDIHGWNFVDDNNDVSDLHGHGTHITGVIKKEVQRHNTGSTSFPPARFMILKYYNAAADDDENVMNTVKAINYAVKMGAQIINYSGGGSLPNKLEMQAIREAGKKDILLIAAAGNNNSNTDIRKYYPANYPLNNIISVAATDELGELVSFSNYGVKSIDIAAPGKLIYSSLPKNSYGFMSGTSQATALVSGAVAALLKDMPIVRKKLILNKLLAQSKFNPSLKGKLKNQVALLPGTLN